MFHFWWKMTAQCASLQHAKSKFYFKEPTERSTALKFFNKTQERGYLQCSDSIIRSQITLSMA